MGQRIGRAVIRDEVSPLSDLPTAWIRERWTQYCETHPQAGFLVSKDVFLELLLPLHVNLFFNYRSTKKSEEERQECLFRYKEELRACATRFERRGGGHDDDDGGSGGVDADTAAVQEIPANTAIATSAGAGGSDGGGIGSSRDASINIKEVFAALILMSSSGTQQKVDLLLHLLFEDSPEVNATETELALSIVLNATTCIDGLPEFRRRSIPDLAVELTNRL